MANHKSSSKKTKKKHKKTLTPGIVIGRIFLVLGSTVAMLVLFVILVITVLLKGPSSEAQKIFTLSTHETSALKWLPTLFLSDTEYDRIINPVAESDDYHELALSSNTTISAGVSSDSITITASTPTEEIELIDVKGGTYQGKMLLVHDPSRVFFGSIDTFGGVGITLSKFLEKYDAIACTNAGGFEDEDGTGKGGIPDGIVIRDGQIVYGNAGSTYVGLAGFDANHILHVGNMTGQQALNLGIVNGTNFEYGPVLIKDGVRQQVNASGINPRTAIGQTADGTVILVSIEGRMADSLGASYEDLADLMEEYGAINAVNMDGGSSAGMYYEGERVTRSCSVIGDRPLPTAIMVSR